MRKNKVKKKDNEILEVGNLLLCIIEVAPQRCIVGESYLHYLMWKVLQDKSFDDMAERVTFEFDEERPWSKELHTAVKFLSKDVSEMQMMEETKIPMILTEVAREGYEKIRESEKWMDAHFNEPIKPKMFVLTPNGVLVAAYSWAALLDERQQGVISDVVKSIIHG